VGIIVRNPWGSAGGRDAQRSDMWVARFDSSLVSTIRASFAGDVQNVVKDSTDLSIYARRISLPEVKVNTATFNEGNQPVQYPDYDDALGPVRITFLHEVPIFSSKQSGNVSDNFLSTNYAQGTYLTNTSEVYSVFHNWMRLGQSGRGGQKYYYDGVSDASRELPKLDQTTYKVKFRFDVTCILLSHIGSASMFSSSSSASPVASAAYVLEKCWCSGLQISELSYDSNLPLTLDVSLQPRRIVPLTGAELLSIGF